MALKVYIISLLFTVIIGGISALVSKYVLYVYIASIFISPLYYGTFNTIKFKYYYKEFRYQYYKYIKLFKF